MNLHILTFDRDDESVFVVYEKFDDGSNTRNVPEYLEIDDVKAGRTWIETNNITPLRENETYHAVFGLTNYEVDDNEKEYILTENQSASFLLRFK